MNGARGRAWLSILLAGAYLTYAWTLKDAFVHRTGGAPGVWSLGVWQWGVELVTLAVAAFGFRCGWSAIPRTAGVLRALVAAALLSVVPFVLDYAAWPVNAALGDAAAAWVFRGSNALAVALTLRHVLRDWPRAERRAPSLLQRRLTRVAAVVGSLLVALLLVEVGYRQMGLGQRAHPRFVIPGDEIDMSLGTLAVFGSLGFEQAGQRVVSPFRPYLYLKACYDRPEWDYFDEDGCVDYVFNSHGMRDDEFKLNKPDDEYRIIAIGDSFTFGLGVKLEDCWTEVLQERLAEQRGQPVEVINAGFVAGFSPGHYGPWIIENGLRMNPDVVIVGLCLNDMSPHIGLYTYPVRSGNFLGGVSRVATGLHASWLRSRTDQVPIDMDWTLNQDTSLWKDTQKALRKLNARLGKRDIRLVVAVLPMLSGLREATYPYRGVIDTAKDFCERNGIECVSLEEPFLGRVDEELWVHSTDQHPSPEGHAIFADVLLDYLAQD